MKDPAVIDEPISIPSNDGSDEPADTAEAAATQQPSDVVDEEPVIEAPASGAETQAETESRAEPQEDTREEEPQDPEPPAADVHAEAEEAPPADPQPEIEEAPAAEVADMADVAEPAETPVAEAPAAEKPALTDDPFGGPGDWYVVHTYAGYENKVKTNLVSRIHTMQMEDKIFRVHIPMEDVMEIKSGKKQVVQKKVFPGYLLVKMFYDNDSWYVVRNTPGVTGFVSAGTGSKPTPLSKREIEKILVVKKEEVKPQFRLGFEEGDVVRIISGPFADFNGTINEINVDQSKLKVLVNIFDRETPVELGFDQVSKV
jgi:transcription termination/antitermination protein NusG